MSLLSSSSSASTSTCYYTARRCAWRAFATSSQSYDHYQTLGVPRGAPKAQIKSHYYQLSKKHHPDVSNDPKSKEIFSNASEAYSVLIDDRQRRAYDRSLSSHSPGPSHPHAYGYSPRAPPSSGSRANHAWESPSRHRHAGFRPPPDYMYTPLHNRPRATSQPGGGGRHYQPPPGAHHDVLRGSRKRDEEAEQQLDQIRNTSGLVRALQVFGALAVSFTVMGGVGGGH